MGLYKIFSKTGEVDRVVLNCLNLGNTCSLCLMNNVDVYFQNCGHTACQDCADKLLEYDGGIDKARCSFCRKDIFKINKLYYI